MKIFKTLLTLCVLTLFIGVTSCQEEKYPDLGDGVFAEIVTNKGTMIAKLNYKKTPVTVANFVALAEGTHPMVDSTFKGKPYFNGIIFHRVMDKFMIQGGDPTGTGTGGPGYKFGDEFDESLKHDKPGILSMANSGPATNGSQFFITEGPTAHLDNRHTVFGELVLGLDVQDSISNVAVEPRSNKPLDSIVMEEVNIFRQGYDARNFDAVKTWETELPLLEEKRKAKEEEARKAKEEQIRVAQEKSEKAAKNILPTFEDYKSKATTSDSGLMTYVLKEGDGEKPATGSTVMVFHESYLNDGTLLGANNKELEEKFGTYHEMKEQRGMYNPAPMKIGPDVQMIPGLKEGVANMKIGDKKFFYIPSHLAFGESGRGNIKPNSDIIFIIEMVEMQK